MRTAVQLILLFSTAATLSPTAAEARPLRVIAAGDLHLGGKVEDPLAGADFLDGDLRFANLEGPLTARGREADGKLQVSPDRAARLRGRFDVVSLANNHALDQGAAGLDDTRRALASVGVEWSDASRNAVLTRDGRAVIVIARFFAPGDALDGDELVRAVEAARAHGAVIVSLHWGHTGSLLPTPAQRKLAARLAAAGASAILGHGPHTLQGFERIGRAVVAYSLGNLAFGCGCTDVADAYALSFRLLDDGAVDEIQAIPLKAGLQRPVERSRDPQLRELIGNLSADLAKTAARAR
jgi:poly-gamma-glutamate synthesis protein (capsule biosynthesis protein)